MRIKIFGCVPNAGIQLQIDFQKISARVATSPIGSVLIAAIRSQHRLHRIFARNVIKNAAF